MIALGLLTYGCTKKIVGSDGSQSIAIMAKPMVPVGEKMAQELSVFRLIVEGDGIDEPLVFPLAFIGGVLAGEATVPAGQRRHFIIQALDGQGVVLYQGDSYADVDIGAVVNVNIAIMPAVPLINLTPHYQNIEMNDSFFVDINAYNLPDMDALTVVLAYQNPPGPYYFPGDDNSVSRGTSLDGTHYQSWYQGNGDSIYVTTTMNDVAGTLTDANGNANLARVKFFSYADWDSIFATTNLSVSVSYYSDTLPDTPDPTIYTDQAKVDMYQMPFK